MSRKRVFNESLGPVSKPMWSSSDMIPASEIQASSRRGNTLVLVTAILVLLVIIATAFITRTQEGRKLAKSQQAAYERNDNVSILKDQLAKDIATSLFARPVDGAVQEESFDDYNIFTTGEFTPAGDPLELRAEATLSGLARSTVLIPEAVFDDDGDFSYDDVKLGYDRFGLDQNSTFDFNFAPYETRAWTNWPDDVDLSGSGLSSDPLFIPFGTGAPIANAGRLRDDAGVVYGVGNPRGNPGFGDTRWLRETEPRRVGNYYGGPYDFNSDAQDPFIERYTHWTHLSWIPTAENGWRVCYDISNVASLDPFRYANGDYTQNPDQENGPDWGFTLSTIAIDGPAGGDRPYHDAEFPVAIQTPYEQWYPNVLPTPIEGPNVQGFVDEFQRRRNLWFNTPRVHFGDAGNFGAIRVSNDLLPNYIDLNGLFDNEGFLSTPKDAFVRGTQRNVVSRTFCDTDGDGFTDSFWFVPPTAGRPGVKQVVGVSVIDNNSMLDMNVATVFDRWSTSGATPADAALVSRLGDPSGSGGVDLDDFDTWTGLLGDPKNRVNPGFFKTVGMNIETRFDFNRWYSDASSVTAQTMLNARGVDELLETPTNQPGPFYGQYRALAGMNDLPELGVRERKLWNNLVQNDFTGTWVDPTTNEAVPYVADRFGINDEIELRAFSGLNHPTRFTRLEGVLGNHVTDGTLSLSPLRSDINVAETSTLRQGNSVTNPGGTSGSLINEQQVRDMRHRMTTLTGVRNEYRPLWLWQTPYFNRSFDYDRDSETYATGDRNDFDEYQTRRRKIDLRQSFSPFGVQVNTPAWFENRRLWLDDLQEVIYRSTTLIATDPFTGRSIPQGYFTDSGWSLDDSDEPSHGSTGQSKFQNAYLKSLRLAPSLAANIESFRDGPIPFTPSANTPSSDGRDILIDQPIHPNQALRPATYDPNTGDFLPDVDLDGDGQVQPMRDDAYIGFEKQPFIMQAFYGLIYPKSSHGQGPGGCWSEGSDIPAISCPNEQAPAYFANGTGGATSATGENYVDDSSKPAILVAIQLGNPFDEPISLYDYSLKVGNAGGQIPLRLLDCAHPNALTEGHLNKRYFADQIYLGPTEPEAPRSAVVFALIRPGSIGPLDDAAFEEAFGLPYQEMKTACLDYLDLAPGELYGYEPDMPLSRHESLVFDASLVMSGKTPESIFSTNGSGSGSSAERPLIQLVRNIYPEGSPNGTNLVANVVVDRLQNDRVEEEDDPRHNGNELALKFERFLTESAPPRRGNNFDPLIGGRFEWSGIRLNNDDFYFTWAHVSRFWGWDVDANGLYDMNEISPRFVYSVTSEPICAFENAPDLDRTLGESDSFGSRPIRGNTLSLSQFETGGPDSMSNPWATPVVYTLPVTKYQDGAPLWKWTNGPLGGYEPGYGLWQNQSTRPDAWEIRGKPTNFPTWTVVDQSGQAAVYGKGFPLETVIGNNELLVRERVTSPTGVPTNFNQTDIVPMDLVAQEQEEFYKGFREDLWASPLQMLLKDGDFEQIGELNHVFLWGPVLNFPQGGLPASELIPVKRTFSELMTNVIEFERPNQSVIGGQTQFVPEWWGMASNGQQLPADEYPVGVGVFANRLDLGQGRPAGLVASAGSNGKDPGRPWRQVLGAGNLLVSAYRPLLPAGAGLFDAVTVDGVGTAINDYDLDGDGQLSFVEQLASEENRFNLARGFTGEPTRGMVNINTAPVEVMRALPQMSRLIYNDYFAWDHGVGNHNNNSKGRNRRSASISGIPSGFDNAMHVRFAETIERYRLGDVFNRDGGLAPAGDQESLPTYADRGFRGIAQPDAVDFPTILNGDPNNEFYGFFPGMRNDAGIVSLGELLTMTRNQYDENQIQSGFPDDLVGSKEWEGKSASVRSFADDPYELSRLGGVQYGLGYPNPQINENEGVGYARERYRLGWRGTKSDEDTSSGYSIPVQNQADARLSTDRNTERLNLNWLRGIGNAPKKVFRPDNVGGDAEEAALLFSGIANMLTTRSDVFTVYFKVRTFSQDPTTGLWDATDKDRIIDESRYMMVIDRSSVSTPSDDPKILAFTKVQ